MEKLCKNCKYFKRYNGSIYNYNDKYGECNCSKFVYGSSFAHSEEKYADTLFYEDYEGYSADFEVGENFGCIHWKEN